MGPSDGWLRAALCGSWESDLGPLEEQQVLIAEPFPGPDVTFQSHFSGVLCFKLTNQQNRQGAVSVLLLKIKYLWCDPQHTPAPFLSGLGFVRRCNRIIE